MDGGEAGDLYRRYGPAVYRRCLRLLRDHAEAQDAAQEVFVRALTHLDGFRFGSPLQWLHGIATRHCLNRLRDESRRGAARARELRTAPAADPAGAIADRDQVVRIIAQLDETTARIAVHHLVDGMTQEEVAAAVGLSRRTVGVKLQAFFAAARRAVA
jgi:RNA polymerase sigma-70 factor (ECF subfamily)